MPRGSTSDRRGQIQCVSEARPKSLEQIASMAAPAPYVIKVDTPTGERPIPCHRIIARLGAIPTRQLIEKAGARFLSDAPDAAPELTARYESTVPGLYVIGALAGFPLIKQAMNQGYEVVEHLLGRTVKPADHDILRERLQAPAQRPRRRCDPAQDPCDGPVVPRREGARPARAHVGEHDPHASPRGRQLFTRGVYSSSVFNVLRGEVHLSAGDGNPMTLRSGQLFGEMALISGRPHEMSAVGRARLHRPRNPSQRDA